MISFMARVYQEFVKVLVKVNKHQQHRVLSSYSFFRFVLVLTLLQTIVVEAIQRGGIISACYWLAANLQIFALNYFLTILICLFFIALTGSLRRTVIFSSIFLLFLAVISLIKKQFLGDPLFPWDFFRLDQAWDIFPRYSGEIIIALIQLGVLILGLIIAVKFLLPRYKAGWPLRSFLLLGIIIAVPILVFYRHTPLETALRDSNIEHIYWAQSENSLKNGFLLGFTMNLESMMISQPEDYNSTEIGRIVEENSPSTAALSAGSSQSVQKPNIVFVLNEAFWDPLKLPGISFSNDPIPFFRELQSKNTAGTMISPVFGGSTAEVEFEILTGLSTKFLPQGAIAYQQYIQQAIPSIPRLLKENGYVTIAIHPYHDWFYKRNTVFPLLGFDHFYSLNDFAAAEVKGEYISDQEVSKKIVQQLQTTSEPSFIFAITMQNHGPYPEDRYLHNDISVEGTISSQGKGILETYAQGLRDADDSLKNLVSQVNQLEEPTVIIFMGDHLPYLGKDYLVYKETGYIQESENKWSLAETLKMKAVPYVIWANYELNVQNRDEDGSQGSRTTNGPEEPLGQLSAQFIGNCLLDYAGVHENFIINFTQSFAKMLPVYGKTVNIDNDGQSFKNLPEHLKVLEEDYWLLQYDILFGQQYFRDYLDD